MKHRHLLASLALAAMVAPLVALADPAAPAASGAVVGSWGVDLANRDLSVKPGDDFERYASGKWLATAAIPADHAAVGAFETVQETVQAQLRDLIAKTPADAKFGALYASYMDERRVEAVSLAPLKADLSKLQAIADKSAFARFMGATNGAFGSALVDFDVKPLGIFATSATAFDPVLKRRIAALLDAADRVALD